MKTYKQFVSGSEACYLEKMDCIEREIESIDNALSSLGEKEVYSTILSEVYGMEEYNVNDDYIRDYLC